MNTHAGNGSEDEHTAYHLMVDLVVKEKDAKAFEKAVTTFMELGGFCRLDPEYDRKTLVFAMRTVAPFEYTPSQMTTGQKVTEDNRFWAQGGETFHRYVHVWKTPTLTNLDLARIMRLSADDKAYTDVDQWVREEIQDFVVRVGFPPADKPSGKYIVRAKRRFVSRDLGRYLFDIGTLFPSLATQHIHSLGLFQNATGPINTVNEFWQTDDPNPDKEPLIAAATKGAQAPGAEKLFDFYGTLPKRDLREVFQPYLDPAVLRKQSAVCAELKKAVRSQEAP